MFGIDVSKHQGDAIDWSKVRVSGIQFMLARASLATTPDPMFHTNISRARKAAIPVLGAYHFLYPRRTVSPVEQARLFVKQIGVADGLLTMLDVETDRDRKTHEVFMPVIADVRAFAVEFARLTDGHPLILYAPAWYWKGHIHNPPAADLGPLNQSRFVDVRLDKKKHIIAMPPAIAFAKVPNEWFKVSHGGWKTATFLQFTSSGKVPGCHGRIDIDAFNGSLEDLVRLTTANAGVLPGAATVVPAPAQPRMPEPPAPEPDADPPVPDAEPLKPDAELPHAGVVPPVPRFHTVVPDDTLWDIAEEFGFGPTHGLPGFRVMIDAFPENARFREDPGHIHPGERVRVR